VSAGSQLLATIFFRLLTIRFRGEPEEPTSPQSPISNLSMHFLPPSSSGELYNPYGLPPHHPHQPQATRLDSSNQPRHRAVTVPAPIQLPSPGHPHNLFPPGPSSAGSSCFDQQSMRPPPIARHASSSSLTGSAPGAMRPGSSARRFEPYSGSGPPVSSPRVISHSVPEYFPPHINLKSNSNSYYYQTSPSAPGSFADFYGHPPQQQQPQAPPAHFPSPYAATAWQQSQSPGQIGRLMPREYAGDPPSSSGSSGSPGPPPGSSGAGTGAGAGWIPGQGQGQWEGSGQYPPGEWREQGQGTGVAQ